MNAEDLIIELEKLEEFTRGAYFATENSQTECVLDYIKDCLIDLTQRIKNEIEKEEEEMNEEL